MFHFYRYAPVPALNVFGYAAGMKADTTLRAECVAGRSARARSRLAGRHVVSRRATGDRPARSLGHPRWCHGCDGPWRPASRHQPARLRRVRRGASRTSPARRTIRRSRRGMGHRLQRRSAPTSCCARRGSRNHRDGALWRRHDAVCAVGATRGGDVRAELGVGDAPLVFSAGRLVSKKGFEYLIDAVGTMTASFPGLRLAVAGDGDLREMLATRARRFGDAIMLLGARTQDDVGRLAAAADVIVVPSVHDTEGNVDGLPNFALEAMATATPIVATRIGGLPQAIEDGVTGRLVPERDAHALAEAIRWLLDNPEKARHIGGAARTLALRQFGWDRVAERLEWAYDQAVERR